MRYAAIDIGTVTCRLLVADYDGTDVVPLHRRCEIANLGAGVDATNMLAPDAIDRVCTIVASYMDDIERLTENEPVQVRCIATSASRDAQNANEFAASLANLGVELTVVPGHREAELSFLGASSGFAGEHLIVSDIGGGSTELIAGIAGERVVHAHSFNIGCRRATERLLPSDPPTQAEIESLIQWVRPEFEGFFQELRDLGFAPERYVAVAGTATSVVSIDRAIEPYDPALVHGQVVDVATLNRVAARITNMTLKERKRVAGLHPDRAPVIVAGLVILQQLLDLSGLSSFTVSESDILEGIIIGA